MPTGTRWGPSDDRERHVLAILRGLIAEKRGRQARIAEATGISQAQLSKYLSGQKSMTLGETIAVCEALGTSLSDVIRMAEHVGRARPDED